MLTLPPVRKTTRLLLPLTIALLMLLPAAAGAAFSPDAQALDAGSAQTIWRFDTTEPIAVLTFDTNTVRGYTGSILDTLATYDVRASFGVTGTFATNNPDLIVRMVAEGHHLMNHSWDHPWFTDISSSARSSQLQRTHDLILDQVGVDLRPYFRPPGGFYDASVLTDMAANGYDYNVMWSVDAQGWTGKSAADITALVVGAIHPGAIVLQHTSVAGDAGALGPIINQLRARGYRFATVADFLGSAPPTPPPPAELYFPETGHWLRYGFLNYWWYNGQLPIFGYPLTEEFTDPVSGRTVQLFERARFEWHPEYGGTPYEVLLGRLGYEQAARSGLLDQDAFRYRGDDEGPDAGCLYFSATGHYACDYFRFYWQEHGLEFGDPGMSYRESLALFGFPISEPFMTTNADGHTVLTQYFERAVFERHPQNPEPYTMLLRRLGAETLSE